MKRLAARALVVLLLALWPAPIFAAEGMKFTAHYSGHNVCAPSRCALRSGNHPGHGYIRDNRRARSLNSFPCP